MEQLQLFGEPAAPPVLEVGAATETQAGAAAVVPSAPAGPVGFVYFMPGRSIQWMVEAAVNSHLARWHRPPAMIRVNPKNEDGARSSLRSLRLEAVAVVPNGGTLACEVETWDGGAA